jgi:hypothetical protein
VDPDLLRGGAEGCMLEPVQSSERRKVRTLPGSPPGALTRGKPPAFSPALV